MPVFVLLIVEALEMAGWMRSIVTGRELNIVAIVLLFAAMGMRRQGRKGMAGQG